MCVCVCSACLFKEASECVCVCVDVGCDDGVMCKPALQAFLV